MALTRRTLFAQAGAAAAALYLVDPHWAGGSHEGSWGDREYWAFADRMQLLIDRTWRPAQRAYIPDGDAGETSYNANLLYTHAAAARAGHTGPARQDERARQLAARLCESPPWRTNPIKASGGCPTAQPTATVTGDQTHECGWGAGLSHTNRQHVVIDTAVVRGLAQAYHARAPLGLSPVTVALIRDRISKAANSTFYAYPALRLNQINWPVEIYAHADAVLGTRHLLTHDCRLQLSRFADALVWPAPGMRSPNTGPGYRFHYLPQFTENHPSNLDSAEYANIVCGVLQFYAQARNAGMAALTPVQLQRLRAWVERVLCGYWTHGGYLNWDTGLGFARWHQIKKPPLAQQALLAIAVSPRFQPTPAYGRWAKYLFDRGCELFDQLAADHGMPPRVMFGVTATPSSAGDDQLAIARMQANAAQAYVLGLSRVRAEEPPPLYAYDPDIGRLAVTTPTYNTAIVAVNQGAFPYGGVELTRLFDGRQRVAANIGGRPPAAFGALVRDRRTGRVTASQRAHSVRSLSRPPLRLVHAPRGVGAHLVAHPTHAYAGPFRTLEAVGTTRGPDVAIHTRHRFYSRFVQTSWRFLPDPDARGAHDVRLLFPSTGRDATATAVLRDGRSVALTRAVRLADIAWLHIAGSECGYVVVIRSRKLPGVARTEQPPAQASAPRPGPTVRFDLIRDGRLRPLTATVRIAPARDAAEAARVARALGA